MLLMMFPQLLQDTTKHIEDYKQVNIQYWNFY